MESALKIQMLQQAKAETSNNLSCVADCSWLEVRRSAFASALSGCSDGHALQKVGAWSPNIVSLYGDVQPDGTI